MPSPLAMVLGQQAPAQNMPTPNVNPTDVSGIYKSSYDAAMEKYKTDMARQNAMWGGLAGLGGAGIQAFGPKLFGPATTAGSTASAAPAAIGAGLADLGAGAATGIGAGASAAGAGILEALPFLAMFSDRRLKTDIARIGELSNGLPVYRFRYHGDDVERIGLMADEVERVHPEAVFDVGGYKAVDYRLAVR